MITIDQQIKFMQDQVKFMKATLPIGVANGRIMEEHATHKMACAHAALETLTQLRGLVTRGAAS